MVPKIESHWKHLNGTVYEVLEIATLQIHESALDGELCVVYQDLQEAMVWVRPLAEFTDGRFKPVNFDGSDP